MCRIAGEGLESMKFLSTAVLVGMLKGHTKNGLNLINAPALAKEAGIEVSLTHKAECGSRWVKVVVNSASNGTHQVQGTDC